MICRTTLKDCKFANEYGYCDSTACHNMDILANIISEALPYNINYKAITKTYSENFITELKDELLDRVRFRCEIQKEYKPEIREREKLCEDCELRNTCVVNPILKDIHDVFDLVNERRG